MLKFFLPTVALLCLLLSGCAKVAVDPQASSTPEQVAQEKAQTLDVNQPVTPVNNEMPCQCKKNKHNKAKKHCAKKGCQQT